MRTQPHPHPHPWASHLQAKMASWSAPFTSFPWPPSGQVSVCSALRSFCPHVAILSASVRSCREIIFFLFLILPCVFSVFPKQFLVCVRCRVIHNFEIQERESTIIDTSVYFVFNNVSGESLVRKIISPIFFHLYLGVRRIGKQFILS